MNIELQKTKITHLVCTYENTLRREETAESVIPDTMPDAGSILMTHAELLLRSKEIEDGRIGAGCTLEGTILYAPEGEAGICALHISAPIGFAFSDPGIGREDTVRLTPECVSAEARIINSRKVLLKAVVSMRAESFAERECLIASDCADASLRFLKKSAPIRFCTAVCEKTFVVAEDLVLPESAARIAELLLCRSSCALEEIRTVAGKAVVQGHVWTELLYENESGKMEKREFSTPFSQILDLTAGNELNVTLVKTAEYADLLPEGEGVGLELHLAAQAAVSEEREISYLADAYSCRCECEIACEETSFAAYAERTQLRETLRHRIELPGEAIACFVGRGAGTCREGAIRAVMPITWLSVTEEGFVLASTAAAECSFDMSGDEGAASFTVRALSAHITNAGAEWELTAELIAEAEKAVKTSVNSLVSVQLDEEKPRDLSACPSLLVVRFEDGDLWSLAKQCASTPELIEQANPNGAEKGSFLLIPRSR